jgi:hypothetical protein
MLKYIAERIAGNFGFYFGKYHIVGLGGPEGKKAFFESKHLDMNEGYNDLFTGTPSLETQKKRRTRRRLVHTHPLQHDQSRRPLQEPLQASPSHQRPPPTHSPQTRRGRRNGPIQRHLPHHLRLSHTHRRHSRDLQPRSTTPQS